MEITFMEIYLPMLNLPPALWNQNYVPGVIKYYIIIGKDTKRSE
jgi:hypothetical protein